MIARLLLDEMFSPALAAELQARGYDVTALAQCPGGPGTPDDAVLDLAIGQERCLLTENVRDFEILRTQRLDQGRPCAGLLYSAAHRFPRTKPAMGRLVNALEERLSSGRLPRPGQIDRLP
ncbi:hypothetical protein Sru01_56390 [Sphaerisporangium rufum]|uniref:DUF5615 domain-containing protein n=1 Tax=Sphaerisporangium rufum TaxID=1381558 RepID=A0A919R6M5_9ACTN|nr:DUF5615 family PIN-like protein [Sphaerisporangium rufum]GII80657.1 hypothetical protein Sru01_56390 [Sphaerisporangium rufum]